MVNVTMCNAKIFYDGLIDVEPTKTDTINSSTKRKKYQQRC